MVEESYLGSKVGKGVATDWVGSCRLYGKDLEFYSNCNGKLFWGFHQRRDAPDLCYEKITLTTGQKG